jgi:UDP:flavonoid glycosyltransferase YjiC (YdhE family)
MILVPTPNHTEQINNASQAEKFGVAKIINQEELTRGKLLEAIRDVFEGSFSERARSIRRKVLKYDGLREVVKSITEAAEIGRYTS